MLSMVSLGGEQLCSGPERGSEKIKLSCNCEGERGLFICIGWAWWEDISPKEMWADMHSGVLELRSQAVRAGTRGRFHLLGTWFGNSLWVLGRTGEPRGTQCWQEVSGKCRDPMEIPSSGHSSPDGISLWLCLFSCTHPTLHSAFSFLTALDFWPSKSC